MTDKLSPRSALPRYSIALVSSVSLAYEVLLMQLFSIIQWHHFAYMIISLALLGYGASGSFLALASRRLLAYYPLAYISNLLLFSLSIVSCYLLAQQIPFNPEEMLWDYSQILRLSSVYLLLALPFFFAANSIGLSLTYHHRNASRPDEPPHPRRPSPPAPDPCRRYRLQQ